MHKIYLCTYLCNAKEQTVQLMVRNKMGGTNSDHLDHQFLLSCSLNEKKLCNKKECPAVELSKYNRLCLEQM